MDKETQIAAVIEFWGLTRRHGESTNSLLARCEIVRNRALTDGNDQMGVEGCVLQLLRAAGTTTEDMIELYRPFGGLPPRTEEEFRQLMTQMRRTGRIRGHAPNNIAQLLHGNRQAHPNAYFVDQPQGSHWQTQQPASVGHHSLTLQVRWIQTCIHTRTWLEQVSRVLV